MKYERLESAIIVFMGRGDSVIDGIVKMAKKFDIRAATFSGIGAVENVTLGGYDIDKKKYYKKKFMDRYELISCSGNISLRNGKPFVHCHCAISGHDFRALSGHLFDATIAVAGEFVIQPLNGEIRRTFDETIGLATWDLRSSEDAG